ncbi:MAG: leucine-rich repeat domain-containing protein [Candidatus Latescibacteria bacterium]|nr:leucine-rich repeat domain-containing protein [Candidatus Latescibacterota bacterium]
MRYALIALLPLSLATAGQALEFADPNLAAVVQEAGGGPEVNELQAGGRGIRELGGIEQLHDLSLLWLADNEVQDLHPLENLPQLTMLDLANNHVEDLSPLSGLSQLTYLNLEINAVTDLGPLSGLDQLQILALDYNTVQDLAPLLGLPALVELNLMGNPLSATALSQQIPALQARGVTVTYDLPADSLAVEGEPTPVWESVGPQGVPWDIGIRSIAVAPSDPQVIYALTQNGLWRSSDGGMHWGKTSLMDHEGVVVSSTGILVDAQDPMQLYWMDGQPESHDLLRSRDGGKHWDKLDLSALGVCTGNSYLLPLTPIAVDPVRANRIYGVHCSSLMLSIDGGETWDYQTVHLEARSPFLLVHPADPQVIYSGFFLGNRTFLGRSGDGGGNWSLPVEQETSIRAIAADPEDSDYLYALNQDSILHSADGGQTWEVVGAAPAPSLRGLLASPQDPAVLLAWTPPALQGEDQSFWESVDHGRHWKQLGAKGASQVVWNPNTPDQVLVVRSTGAAAGTLERLHVQTQQWERIRLQEQVRPAETVVFAPGGQLYVGSGQWEVDRYQPSLLVSGDGGSHWEEQLEAIARPAAGVTLGATFEMSLGPIGQLFIASGQPDLMLAHTKIWFLCSTDAGRNWAPVFLGQRDYLSMGYSDGSPAQSSIAQLAQPGNRYYLVDPQQGGGLYKSSAPDKNWTLVNPSIGAVVSNGAGRLYAAVDNFRVSSSDDGGVTWTRLSRLPASIFTLAIDPQYQDRIYALTGLGLLLSRDGGKIWHFLLERAGGRWGNAKLALAPQDTLSMYVATGRQLWGTQDGGKRWESIGRGLGDYAWFNDVAVDPANPSLVYAAPPRACTVGTGTH